MNNNYFSKQLLEEKYSSVLSQLIECENDNLLLAQVCKSAFMDLVSTIDPYSIEEFTDMDIPYSRIYNDFYYYYTGATYGKSMEVCNIVEHYSNDKAFVEKMLKHAEHYLNSIGVAA